nr:glycosyltransferase family 4 protein [uncultured Arsenicibacter sp.]
MHILLLHQYFLPEHSPGSIRWNELVHYWADEGHRITVLAGTIDYMTGNPYAGKNEISFPASVRIIRVRVPGCYQAGAAGRLWAYCCFLINSLWHGWFITDQSVNVIIASSPPLTIGLAGWILSVKARVPLILELRDLWPDARVQLGYLRHPLLRRAAYRLERFLYRKAAHLVVLTEDFKHVLINRKGISAARITVIPNGADLSMVEAGKRLFDREAFRKEQAMATGFWIIYAGAHGPANGLTALLDAATCLRHTPVRFLLIGDGPMKKQLQALAFHRNLTNVRFHASKSKKEVLPFLLAADAGLVMMQPKPLFNTMLSAKLFDYLACGLPVLTAIDGLTRTLLTDAGAGLFLDPTQPDTWEKCLTPLLTDPAVVRQYSRNARQLAVTSFDRQTQAHTYIQLLKTCIQNS